MLNKKDIIKSFSNIGVTKGDILVLQSSYKGCGQIENGPEGLIEALKELLGEEGTLIMPAYNFNMWTEQHYFDIIETPSNVGIIAEVFRKQKDVARTSHPIHNFSIWGKYQEEFVKLDYKSSFSEDSIFARLNEKNAIYATIGLGEKMPFLPCHYTEVAMNVSYRRLKDFAGIYVDVNRNSSLRIYSFHVRTNSKNPVYEGHSFLIKNNKVKSYIYNDVIFCYSRAKEYHQNFIEYIKEFPELFSS